MNGDNNGHDEAFTDVKLEVPASTPTGDQPSYDRGERIKSEIGIIKTVKSVITKRIGANFGKNVLCR